MSNTNNNNDPSHPISSNPSILSSSSSSTPSAISLGSTTTSSTSSTSSSTDWKIIESEIDLNMSEDELENVIGAFIQEGIDYATTYNDEEKLLKMARDIALLRKLNNAHMVDSFNEIQNLEIDFAMNPNNILLESKIKHVKAIEEEKKSNSIKLQYLLGKIIEKLKVLKNNQSNPLQSSTGKSKENLFSKTNKISSLFTNNNNNKNKEFEVLTPGEQLLSGLFTTNNNNNNNRNTNNNNSNSPFSTSSTIPIPSVSPMNNNEGTNRNNNQNQNRIITDSNSTIVQNTGINYGITLPPAISPATGNILNHPRDHFTRITYILLDDNALSISKDLKFKDSHIDKVSYYSWLTQIKNCFNKSYLFSHLMLNNLQDSYDQWKSFRKYNYYDSDWNDTIEQEYISVHKMAFFSVIQCFPSEIQNILSQVIEDTPLNLTIPYVLNFKEELKRNPIKQNFIQLFTEINIRYGQPKANEATQYSQDLYNIKYVENENPRDFYNRWTTAFNNLSLVDPSLKGKAEAVKVVELLYKIPNTTGFKEIYRLLPNNKTVAQLQEAHQQWWDGLPPSQRRILNIPRGFKRGNNDNIQNERTNRTNQNGESYYGSSNYSTSSNNNGQRRISQPIELRRKLNIRPRDEWNNLPLEERTRIMNNNKTKTQEFWTIYDLDEWRRNNKLVKRRNSLANNRNNNFNNPSNSNNSSSSNNNSSNLSNSNENRNNKQLNDNHDSSNETMSAFYSDSSISSDEDMHALWTSSSNYEEEEFCSNEENKNSNEENNDSNEANFISDVVAHYIKESPKSSTMLFDSCCTEHIIGDRRLIDPRKIKKLPRPIILNTISGSVKVTDYVEEFIINKNLKLFKVRVLPENKSIAPVNLISLTKAAEASFYILLSPLGCWLVRRKPTDEIIQWFIDNAVLVGLRENKMWGFKVDVNPYVKRTNQRYQSSLEQREQKEEKEEKNDSQKIRIPKKRKEDIPSSSSTISSSSSSSSPSNNQRRKTSDNPIQNQPSSSSSSSSASNVNSNKNVNVDQSTHYIDLYDDEIEEEKLSSFKQEDFDEENNQITTEDFTNTSSINSFLNKENNGIFQSYEIDEDEASDIINQIMDEEYNENTPFPLLNEQNHSIEVTPHFNENSSMNENNQNNNIK